MEEKFLTSGQVAKLLSVTPMTLRNWDKLGKLKPHHVSPSGYRYYSEQQMQDFFNISKNSNVKEISKNVVLTEKIIPDKVKRTVVEVPKVEINAPSKKPLFKIFVDVGKNELWLDYYVMRSGKTNSLALAINDKLFTKVTENIGGQEIIIDDGKSTFVEPMHGVSITVEDKDLNKLNASITKAILWIQLCFTNKLGFDHPPDDVIENARYMKWQIDDYMTFCGLKDRDKAIEKMKHNLALLSQAEIQWQEEIIVRDDSGQPIYSGGYRNKHGKFVPKIKREKHTFRGTFISTRDLHPVNGAFSYWINKEFATYLAHAGVVAVHKEIFNLNLQKHPHSVTLATKLNEYFSMNRGKEQAHKLSVPVLLNAMPNIPKYESLRVEEIIIAENGIEEKITRNGERGGWRQRIFNPFQNAFNALVEQGILTEWHFSECEIPKNYDEFINQYVYFTPNIQVKDLPLSKLDNSNSQNSIIQTRKTR